MISIPQTAGPVELWSVLVLCTLRLNCNWDYEELLKTDNNHKAVRDFLGYTLYEFGEQYALETLKDNVSLFTPEHIDQINQVAKVGYKMLGYDKKSINCV
jgi:transposase, IS5 family